MFREVETFEDLKIFENIYLENCRELGVTSHSYHEPCRRFLILDEEEPIGTVEIVQRNDNFSIVDDYFSFKNHPELHSDLKKVYEIGKIGIIPSKRGKDHIKKIIGLLYQFIVEEEPEQFVAVINKMFHRLLMLQFRVRMARIGDDLVYPNSILLPVIGDCKKIRKTLEKNGFADEFRKITLV